MSAKNYILFDLDGTLTDPKEGITKSVQYALHNIGIEEDCDNLLRLWILSGNSMDWMMKHATGL